MLVTKDVNIPLFDLITCLSDVIDLVNPELVNHHSKVAYIAYSIGTQLDLSRTERNELLLAGKLHDIGALSCQERMNTLRFELNNPRRHAEMGGELLKGFAPLSRVAELIRFHHVHWDGGNGKTVCGEPVPIGSHVLHLADRLAVLIGNRRDILKGTDAITRLVADQSGGMFMPELVDAFLKLSKKEYFWLDVISPSIAALLRRRVSLGTIDLNLDGLISLGQVFAKIIDFRSRFTATHSSGVAAGASALARIAGCSERECQMMKVAGFLHDMGKLAIPAEILEKPGKLSADERKTVSCHPFYTYRTL
ncbi:MAG TPA: HD domain-containing phosphohydrolase, partial [Geobacteraceae bacterium]